MYFVKKSNNNLLDDFYNFFGKSNISNLKTDLKDEGNKYSIDVEIPGANKKDININFEDGYLNINVTKEEVKEDNKNYVIKERVTSSMNRSYYLEDIDEASIKAKYDNGILHIEATKTKPVEEKAKLIAIE